MNRFAGILLLAATATALTPKAAAAHPGTGIAVDAAGRVYFTDLTQVWRLDPDGTLQVVVPHRHSHALRLESDGSLSGEHLSYDGSRFWTSAWRRAPDGVITQTAPVEGFPFLFTPAVAPDGTRYYYQVDNHKRDRSVIFRQRAGSKAEPFAGGAYGHADGAGTAARFGSIGALAVGPAGTLFVTDAPALRRVSPDGRVSTIARGGDLLKQTLPGRLFGGLFGWLIGLAPDPAGSVYVANFGGRRVVRVSGSGSVTSVLESEAPWAPSGVALAQGAIYVLEAGSMPGSFDAVRVRRIIVGGRASTLAVIRDGKPEKRKGVRREAG